jgi:hypothetical protein
MCEQEAEQEEVERKRHSVVGEGLLVLRTLQ